MTRIVNTVIDTQKAIESESKSNMYLLDQLSKTASLFTNIVNTCEFETMKLNGADEQLSIIIEKISIIQSEINKYKENK